MGKSVHSVICRTVLICYYVVVEYVLGSLNLVLHIEAFITYVNNKTKLRINVLETHIMMIESQTNSHSFNKHYHFRSIKG